MYYRGLKRTREYVTDREKNKHYKKDMVGIISRIEVSEERDLDLSSMEIDANDATVAFEHLKDNHIYESLDFSFNNLGSDGLYQFSRVIRGNNHIKSADFFDNMITDRGVEAISYELRESNHKIKNLNLSGNYISSEGAAKLMEGTGLEELYLSWNYFGDIGAFKISNALESNKTLRKIDISSTNITDIGAKKIIGSLKNNKSILDIDISGNNISSHVYVELEQLLARNNKLSTYSKPNTENAESFIERLNLSRSSSEYSAMDIS